MKSKKVVLCACSMGVSHLVPMVELAKQFINRGISVTIPVTNVGPDADFLSEFCNSNIIPNISYHILPQVTLSNPHPVPFVNAINMMKLHNDSLCSFLIEQSQTSSISAVILDMFCVDALDVASELRIPAYFFMASGATTLAVFFQLSTYFATHALFW
ncbi:UDP-glycosyltransferase 88B1-like [Carex rostrata]